MGGGILRIVCDFESVGQDQLSISAEFLGPPSVADLTGLGAGAFLQADVVPAPFFTYGAVVIDGKADPVDITQKLVPFFRWGRITIRIGHRPRTLVAGGQVSVAVCQGDGGTEAIPPVVGTPVFYDVGRGPDDCPQVPVQDGD